jgi:hypothetical protein
MAAPKGNKFGKNGGRPPIYRQEFIEQAAKLCRLGATDIELADFFKVTRTTVTKWKNQHEEFAAALKAGKESADERVVRSLYARATGYEYDAVKIFCNKDGVVTKVKYRERLAPDTTACIFWLKNRRKDLWRDRPEAEQTLAFDPNESIEDIRDELLRDMAGAGLVKLLPAPPPEPGAPAGVGGPKGGQDEAQRQRISGRRR